MISTSLNHCKEMGAEPGRRSLKMPAEKLGPVIGKRDMTLKLHNRLKNEAALIIVFQNKSSATNPYYLR